MKKMILILLPFMFFAVSSFSQIRKVPSEVTNALKAKYPSATNIEWKDKVTYFKAEFTVNGAGMSADFSNSGEWKETEKLMDFDKLPAAVKDGFHKSKYADWKPGTVTYIEKDDKSSRYKIYIEKNSLVQKRNLYFNTAGQLEKDELGL